MIPAAPVHPYSARATMTDEAFLKAILADPDDDAPRLIYADWLDEHGDGDRAEFIRAQCGPGRPDLEARARDLLAVHEASWVAPLRGLAVAWEFRRGFVEAVTCDARTFARRARELFALAPVSALRLRGLRGCVAALTNCPYLARPLDLDLSLNSLGQAGTYELMRWRHLRYPRRLDLSANRIGAGGARAILSNPDLFSLDEIVLSRNPIPERELEELRWRFRQRVRL